MKRGSPLKRTPLARGSTALKRSRIDGERKPLRKVGARAKREEPQLRAAKRAVRKRSGGWCEVDGCDRKADDYHHLKRRSRGGEHTAENLVHWCRVHHDREHFG